MNVFVSFQYHLYAKTGRKRELVTTQTEGKSC